jgi:SAM-dependent methyltransferase/methyltransferase-like protein
MSDWTSGYVAEIDYTYGYYNELAPNRATLAFLNAGYAPPSSGVHCELGFGQGLSVNIHAAASGSTWYANDFNPSQAAFAQSLASASGADAHLTDEAFADFCNRSDLPDFDSIGLHGIWSWISDENRSIIVEFIRRKLKVGGVLYISYNTQPGWAAFAPMRHLMTEHASVMGSSGKGVVSRVDGALDFAQKLLDTNPLFAKANPSVVERLKKVASQDRHYLAHEYFNKDWHPMHFATMSQWLSPAKIDFACSAHYYDHVSAVNLSAEQQAMLNEITDQTFKESVRDFMVNQQFRRDYWVKGPRKLSATEQTELLNQHKLVLLSARENISLKISGSLGEASLSEAVYLPILDLMSDHKARSLQEITAKVQDKSIGFAQVVQSAMVLVGAGHMASVQSEAQIAKAKQTSSKLNKALMEKSRFSAEISFLASPLTGGGIAVNRFQQLFLLSMGQGKQQPEDWAKEVWSVLSSQNQRLLKEGKTLDSAEDNLKELIRQAKEFADKRLSVLKALEVL